MGNPITLADFKIGGDRFVIELVESPKHQATVTITWPSQPTSMSDRRFPEVAASLTRTTANAAMVLARIEAGDRR